MVPRPNQATRGLSLTLPRMVYCTCTGLTDDDCLRSKLTASSSLTFDSSCSDDDFDGATFVADGFYDGRRRYVGPLYDAGIIGPYVIQYDNDKFTLYQNDLVSDSMTSVASEAANAAVEPKELSKTAVSLVTAAQRLTSAMLRQSPRQVALSMDNIAASTVLGE